MFRSFYSVYAQKGKKVICVGSYVDKVTAYRVSKFIPEIVGPEWRLTKWPETL